MKKQTTLQLGNTLTKKNRFFRIPESMYVRIEKRTLQKYWQLMRQRFHHRYHAPSLVVT